MIWHARDFVKGRFWAVLCGRRAEHIIAVSTAVKGQLQAYGVGGKKVTVIANGIEMEESEGAGKRENGVRKAGEIVFGNVGQFVPWKRQKLFLEAAELVARVLPGARFILAGDDLGGSNGSYKRELLKLVGQEGLRARVKWAGWQEAGALWREMDCLVHTAGAEPFGRVVLEAMAAGVMVIAAATGGPAEIIQDGVTGLLVARDTPEAWGEAMVRMAKQGNQRQELARAGRQYARANFSAVRTAQQVMEIYRRIPERSQ